MDMKPNRTPAAKSEGFILLMLLLIGVVVGIAFYFIVLVPADVRDAAAIEMQKENPERYPWVEEERLAVPKKSIPSPVSDEQPTIPKTIYYTARINDSNDNPRGSMALSIDPDGILKGSWGGEYDTASPRMNYSIVFCKFKGNIDPSKIYEDENGQDMSRLFFIAKGEVVMLVTNFESGKVYREKSFIYVNGWIDRNYHAAGRIVITANKADSEMFVWESDARDTPIPVL